MDKDVTIKVRNTLKAGKNLPLIVYINNSFRTIDETSVFQFTKWDDDAGILYLYSLVNPITSQIPSNIGGELSLFAVSYDTIEAMEVARLPYSELENSINSLINVGGVTISDTYKKHILNMFKTALTNNPNLTRTDINKAMGIIDGNKALDDGDSYYAGTYKESFKENIK